MGDSLPTQPELSRDHTALSSLLRRNPIRPVAQNLAQLCGSLGSTKLVGGHSMPSVLFEESPKSLSPFRMISKDLILVIFGARHQTILRISKKHLGLLRLPLTIFPSKLVNPPRRLEACGHKHRSIPSTPAFWDVRTPWRSYVPASPEQRGRVGWGLKGLRLRQWCAGGLLRSRESRPHRAPRGVPGVAIVPGAPRCRMVDQAQLRTRHVPMNTNSACPGRPRSRLRSWPLIPTPSRPPPPH